MQTIFRGSIEFGLVSIPIKLHAATEDRDIKLRQLHAECKNPVKQLKFCPVCNREVDLNELVKGYEYASDRFIVISDEELAGIKSDVEDKSVEIIEFIRLSEIDPIFFDKTYYLASNTAGTKAYALLKESLMTTRKAGIVKITIRSKERLAVIRVFNNYLVLETLHFPDEIRSTMELSNLSSIKLTKKEKEVALALIEQMTEKFDPSNYYDEYREKLEKLIKTKMPKRAEPVPDASHILSLMDAMERSIVHIQQQKQAK
ncbi:Ku protein [Domibacillus sp. A3M-37]|uniref:non-homologous end joining protein Ku n=1 Tax=Domibacillus sp. A3M-37 TaxID=2962037 RepID=UPI0020B74EDE|nr:Ku protein [Domibacillus sp. A3M-37]MCP3762269.1 Ku protein [Domibacillus sp. A3M-37]